MSRSVHEFYGVASAHEGTRPQSHDNVARFDLGKLLVRAFSLFGLQLVGNAIGCTFFRFVADNVCCDATWMRFLLNQ